MRGVCHRSWTQSMTKARTTLRCMRWHARKTLCGTHQGMPRDAGFLPQIVDAIDGRRSRRRPRGGTPRVSRARVRREMRRKEVPPGFEPGNNGFADRSLTTWVWHRRGRKIVMPGGDNKSPAPAMPEGARSAVPPPFWGWRDRPEGSPEARRPRVPLSF